jgi:hypothetical protein
MRPKLVHLPRLRIGRGCLVCFGGFVVLDDTVCTLTDAPTGAIRYVLACGPCELVVMPPQ